MMIHAYSEDYLNNAQKILGDMMDYAVNTYEFSPNQFYEMFLVSDVSMQFQTGKNWKMKCIWINLRSTGVVGHWPIINGTQGEAS